MHCIESNGERKTLTPTAAAGLQDETTFTLQSGSVCSQWCCPAHTEHDPECRCVHTAVRGGNGKHCSISNTHWALMCETFTIFFFWTDFKITCYRLVTRWKDLQKRITIHISPLMRITKVLSQKWIRSALCTQRNVYCPYLDMIEALGPQLVVLIVQSGRGFLRQQQCTLIAIGFYCLRGH